MLPIDSVTLLTHVPPPLRMSCNRPSPAGECMLVEAPVWQDLDLMITIPNFDNSGLRHSPFKVITRTIRELTTRSKHSERAVGGPADLLANKIIFNHGPAFSRLAQLGIRCRCANGCAGKSGSEESASDGHHSSSQVGEGGVGGFE